MGFSSQTGQVVFRTQAVAGTYQADTGTAGVAVRTRSGGLTPNRSLLIPDPEIGGGRDMVDAYLGAVSFTGTYEFYARMKSLPLFLKGVLGSEAIATTTGISTHTITTATTLPWFSIEDDVSTLEQFQYTDSKINTFHLEAAADGYLMGTVGVIAKKQTAGNTRTATPTNIDTSPMTVGTNITVTYNGVAMPAQSFSLDINNNIEDSDFRLGSFYLGDVTEKRREMTMGVTVRPADSGLWRQAVYGVSSATAPGGLTTKQQVIITMTTYESIPGGTPTTSYTTTITAPTAVLKPLALNPSGDDVISNAFEIEVLQPNPATPIITAVVKNDVASPGY